jgi:hypothetical protein
MAVLYLLLGGSESALSGPVTAPGAGVPTSTEESPR